MEAIVVYKKEFLEFFNGLGVLSFILFWFCFAFICSQVKYFPSARSGSALAVV